MRQNCFGTLIVTTLKIYVCLEKNEVFVRLSLCSEARVPPPGCPSLLQRGVVGLLCSANGGRGSKCASCHGGIPAFILQLGGCWSGKLFVGRYILEPAILLISWVFRVDCHRVLESKMTSSASEGVLSDSTNYCYFLRLWCFQSRSKKEKSCA